MLEKLIEEMRKTENLDLINVFHSLQKNVEYLFENMKTFKDREYNIKDISTVHFEFISIVDNKGRAGSKILEINDLSKTECLIFFFNFFLSSHKFSSHGIFSY